MNRLIYNGQLVNPDQLLFYSGNRSFRYGDGLFETMRFREGKLLWLDKHIHRLHQGMRILGFENIETLDRERLLSDLEKLNPPNPCRIRLTVFRTGGGAYLPESDRYEYLMEAWPLQLDRYAANPNGLNCTYFREVRLPVHQLANLKTASALPYVLASRFAHHQGLDDCFLFNIHDRIAEATASNIFLLTGNQFLTPPLQEGCVAGVMRRVLIHLAGNLGYQVIESPVTTGLLEKAESLWLTNAIRGIQWVGKIADRTYIQGPLLTFVDELNKMSLAE